MKKLVLATQKGGPGKTTLAGHIAVAAELAGIGPVVMIDTDPQGSLAAWWNAREAESPAFASSTIKDLSTKLEALAQAGFKLVVIDTPPAITTSIESVVELADLVLIPARPSPHDLRAVGSTVDIVNAAKRPFAFIATQAKPNARLTVQAMATLSAHGEVAPVLVHDRVDFASSMIDGQTVQETGPNGRSADEVGKILAFVLERLKIKTKAKKREAL
ncbi:chromosome partitioning protein [Bartonella australis AUST/NH1]|uniref:Chromosome partitioning protein n=1 Tax=Bartonella australis (strain Aust/NH1) TaxID=1094489 RepID=M1NWU1_BARAA|nr:ParA family protein [Bartonella australis]AGF73952.1 chromosome partitioning protein [Bartonella australis AUST/NH1]